VKWPFRSSSQAATCYYQSNHSKVEAIPLSVLPMDTTNELAGFDLHTIPLMLNVKQGSYEYQLFNLLVWLCQVIEPHLYQLWSEALITRSRAIQINNWSLNYCECKAQRRFLNRLSVAPLEPLYGAIGRFMRGQQEQRRSIKVEKMLKKALFLWKITLRWGRSEFSCPLWWLGISYVDR